MPILMGNMTGIMSEKGAIDSGSAIRQKKEVELLNDDDLGNPKRTNGDDWDDDDLLNAKDNELETVDASENGEKQDSDFDKLLDEPLLSPAQEKAKSPQANGTADETSQTLSPVPKTPAQSVTPSEEKGEIHKNGTEETKELEQTQKAEEPANSREERQVLKPEHPDQVMKSSEAAESEDMEVSQPDEDVELDSQEDKEKSADVKAKKVIQRLTRTVSAISMYFLLCNYFGATGCFVNIYVK